MIQHPPTQSVEPPVEISLRAFLALFFVFYAPLVAVSNPALSAAALAVSVVVIVTYRTIDRRLSRQQGTHRTIDVPGLGTIEYRFTRSKAN